MSVAAKAGQPDRGIERAVRNLAIELHDVCCAGSTYAGSVVPFESNGVHTRDVLGKVTTTTTSGGYVNQEGIALILRCNSEP
jgi:hypothetical protein